MKREYIPIALIGLGFVIAFFWSVWSETLQPLIRAGDTQGLLFQLLGIPIILIGLITFVYGGFRCLRDMFDLVKNETFLQHAAMIRERPSPEAVRTAQRVHLRLWMKSLGRGARWMLLAFICIGIGGYIINL